MNLDKLPLRFVSDTAELICFCEMFDEVSWCVLNSSLLPVSC